MTGWILSFIAAYFIGAIPFGYIAVRWIKGEDIRAHGSGNIGATNVIRLCGLKTGLLVLLLDALKGAVAVLIPFWIGAANTWPDLPIYTGLVAVCGHNWTVFLNFKGGKGVATSTGVFATLAPVPFLIAIAGFGIILVTTRIVSLSSMIGAILLLVVLLIQRAVFPGNPPSWALIFVAAVAVVFILVRHRENIRRLLNGSEHPFEWRKKAKE